MLAGFFTFAMTYFTIKNYRISKIKTILGIFLFCGILLLIFLFYTGVVEIPDFITDMSIYRRFVGKVEDLLSESSNSSIMADREWERVFTSPEYMIFGAGEGKHDRFGTYLEIHSSILGPLFYYGFIPFTLFLLWFKGKVKNLDRDLWCVYIALLVESFFLVNTRQPMFWMIIALAGCSLAKRSK